MHTISCTICITGGEVTPVNGLIPALPTGWSTTTIAERGSAVRNFVLCRTCTAAVRATLSRCSAAHRDAVTP
ncbi:hypothetical protein SAMN05892883_2095 [Jatrophihabitans sp. GAS493]|uniref:hypothetical protein n=1 Tax=Jatrophihabitans sp. GAS493 TaxID=1907575 RepID=UPI000BB77DA4|nr:hypothetical protein [Jatrophihabitans sp. GAS493]SOD72749.1 hypothetical protein SAMN05892883_2095 [Jatrophihabitans sp. GAS493]